MEESRRKVLQTIGGIGAVATLPTMARAKQKQRKVVTFKRPYNNPLAEEKVVELQERVLSDQDRHGIVTEPDISVDGRIVGVAFGTTEEGKTATYVGTVGEGDSNVVDDIHADVRDYKRRFKRGDL